jgi:predicted metal-dependent phosphoesterase TrpH
MVRFDHHIHTTRYSPDSVISPSELLESARMAGLDGVVITEHDAQWERLELEELGRSAGDLVVLSGAEISAQEGHFLVYGLPDLDEIESGIELAELLDVVRALDAAIVAAHPFRWGQDFAALIDQFGPVFDALELVSNNVTPDMRRRTADLLERYPEIGATGSSDAHEAGVVGCYFTEFPGPIRCMGDFVAALRSRAGRPRHRADARLCSGPVG